MTTRRLWASELSVGGFTAVGGVGSKVIGCLDTVAEMQGFDPNAAADASAGIFGLPTSRDEAEVVLLPVPFAATVSYGRGAERGPAAILAASRQVDLFDLQTGRPYLRGIHMVAIDEELVRLDAVARAARDDDPAVVDAAGERVNEFVGAEVRSLLEGGKLPGVVGGDHSVPFAAIRAAASHLGRPLGVLHIDAHADLRVAYEGFRWSHASIFDNVLREVPGVARLAQVGVRDFCEQEFDAIRAADGRVLTWFDLDWKRRLGAGERLVDLCDEVVAALPEDVWISFDIDGLDPALCPHTGTPVPGGLSFDDACLLLERLVASERRIAGFDLCEVAPGPDGDEWDANVGARVLYKLCGFALLTR